MTCCRTNIKYLFVFRRGWIGSWLYLTWTPSLSSSTSWTLNICSGTISSSIVYKICLIWFDRISLKRNSDTASCSHLSQAAKAQVQSCNDLRSDRSLTTALSKCRFPSVTVSSFLFWIPAPPVSRVWLTPTINTLHYCLCCHSEHVPNFITHCSVQCCVQRV